MKWLKRLGCAFVLLIALVLAAAGFVYVQGIQYLVAWTLTGYARPLPAADAYPVEPMGGPNPCASGPMTVVTYNTFNGSAFVEDMVERYADGNLSGMRPWSERVPEIRERIASYDADLIGFQEMGFDADIRAIVPEEAGYTLVSFRAGSFEYGDSALLFRKARFEMLDSGQLWLTPTPELPLSFGFLRGSMLRYAGWALLRERDTGFTFLFVNTHFDNNTGNKVPASALFRERISALAAGLPMVVTGDFNSNAETERYGVFTGADAAEPLLKNAFHTAPPGARRYHHRATMSGEIPADDTHLHPGSRIDHIFTGGPCPARVLEWTIDLRNLKNGEPMSDHELIAARLMFGSAPDPDAP